MMHSDMRLPFYHPGKSKFLVRRVQTTNEAQCHFSHCIIGGQHLGQTWFNLCISYNSECGNSND